VATSAIGLQIDRAICADDVSEPRDATAGPEPGCARATNVTLVAVWIVDVMYGNLAMGV
jgi:hypothetical protein